MRVLSWNCAGGLRWKIDRALDLDADVVVIQEAHDPEHYLERVPAGSPTYWHTAPDADKGIFVWARPGWSLELHPVWDGSVDFHQIVPLLVTPPGAASITVWAVWTHAVKPSSASYVGQAHRALDEWEDMLGSRSIAIGDFNSNAIWDHKLRRNHSLLVERFAALGLTSAYHAMTGEAHGRETTPTQWQARRADWPFHLDYAFVGAGFEVVDVSIGAYVAWCLKAADGGVSDHAPLLVELAPR